MYSYCTHDHLTLLKLLTITIKVEVKGNDLAITGHWANI